MNNDDLLPFEKWKDIPLDTKFRYQASNLGRIAHVYPDGHRRVLSECYIKSMSGYVTGITMADGTYRKFQTVSLVARAWIGNRDKSWQAVHKNGIKSDHRISNIRYIKRNEVGQLTNRSKRKAVFKIDSSGEVVEVYKSAKECAEANHYQYATIKRRCKGDFKTVLASDGFAYCYESNTRLFDRIIRELELLNDTPIVANRTANYEFDF